MGPGKASGALLLCAALAAWGAGGLLGARAYASPLPSPAEIRAPLSGAAADMFSLAFGARRLFAELWFVRLLQYYGTKEGPDGDEGAAHVHGPHCDHGPGYGTGHYPEFFARARHVLELDPDFVSAGLYSAGSLAFNLDRVGEAEAILMYGLKYKPREWKYLQVLAAIGYSSAKDPAAVAKALEPVLKDPDCPAMLKQLAAFLNKHIGNYARAAEIYADILATSRDPFYLQNARRELDKLGAGRGR